MFVRSATDMTPLSKNKIKWIRSLRLKKNRDKEHLFVVEGAKMVQEISDQWNHLVECYVTTDPESNFPGETYQTDTATMKSISALNTPGTMLAVVRQPELPPSEQGLILALDGIQDPGNMGTIIRTADWFGVSTIVCSNETVDIFNPKVIQSSMGSLFRVSVVYTDLVEYLDKSTYPKFGALMEGEAMPLVQPEENAILIMGNEGNGVSPEIIQCIDRPVHIPGKGDAESLNVAVATGILLAHFSQ